MRDDLEFKFSRKIGNPSSLFNEKGPDVTKRFFSDCQRMVNQEGVI